MKACGIVVEYNPLHNGHVYHINKSKEITGCDVLIAVMSGNWTQRGEPALVSKEIRTKAALKNGVDLVVELPFLVGVNGANFFASGAVEILNYLKVSDIVFGSESGTTEEFKKKYFAHGFYYPRESELIADYMDQGMGYPKARSLALKTIADYYLETPNDILATAYVDAIIKNSYPINYHTIARTAPYHQGDEEYKDSSASKIRSLLQNSKSIEGLTPMEEEIKSSTLHFLNDYFPLLRYKLLSSSKEELQKIHLVEEGIESLFIKNINIAKNMEEFIKLCISKRYSGARIIRTICHILNNSDKEFAKSILNNPLPYVRILGSNKKGREYLSSMRKELEEVEILNRYKGRNNPLLEAERKATSVYLSTINKVSYLEELEKEIKLYPIIVE
jgi:predicted nucleotidyltransferase